MFRKAQMSDLDAVEAIYDKIHAKEDAGLLTTGWVTGIYPLREDAENALARDDLYVYEENGRVLASGIINKLQVDVYAGAPWLYAAPDEGVLVLHTLTVDPEAGGRGIGRAFAQFYEQTAREMGCTVLRIDTNERNAAARHLYQSLGFRETDTVLCTFNGIRSIHLVLLEKKL